jgi:3-methylcrotonyl-CoA carboxylase alpha subunit
MELAMLKKCLVANRGEIAVRIMRACRELGIRTVAVYSTVDAKAQFVQLADEAYPIGEPAPQQSYLNVDKLIAIAKQSGCDCVHPGYGFLSERAYFAQAVQDNGLVWVGPNPFAIEQMGVKTTARDIMQRANVPVVPGYQSNTATLDELMTQAQQVGFPLMVKAAGGGGGKGIRIVRDPQALHEALLGAQSEAQKAFNDPRLFLERYIEHGRHIEVQIIGDRHGNLLHLYERECSTQRRHQKIIEESPAPYLTPEQRERIGQIAVMAGKAVNYVNAGTVEFIATPDHEVFFLEMNTRLQVEHPVTELVTGIDLVKWQFRVANGEALPLTQSQIQQRGHAIECRVYAEDARNGFLPAIGTVEKFVPPSGVGVRVDSGIQSGDAITIHYDPMIAKVIVYDSTRELATRRMLITLREMVILGTITNVDFLIRLLQSEAFQQAQIDTTTLDQHLNQFLPPVPELPEIALLVAALNDFSAQTKPQTSTATSSDSDAFSAWNQADGFRLGGD